MHNNVMPGLQVVIVYNKENKVLDNVCQGLLKMGSYTVRTFDVREPPQMCQVCIHLGEPCAVWFPWAKVNYMLVEEWNPAWDGYLPSFALKTGWKTMTTETYRSTIDGFLADESVSYPMPPVLLPEECPPISVITLVYNRPKFIENACLNLLNTDYPKEKIEWIVVDDSDADQSPSNRIVQFQTKFPGKVTYIPLTKKAPIGSKRNLAVDRASNSIILMMDDDDHYPSTSFRRRVAYLVKGRKYECAVCTTIAMYDLNTGISAVNCPPFDLSLGQRCSEATLTFTKSFWKKRLFEAVSMAEGEEFIKGRESSVVEMPPQQIIVAMTHGTNTSRRKIPEGKPGCFWGFPRELLEFLHGLVGVKVEAE